MRRHLVPGNMFIASEISFFSFLALVTSPWYLVQKSAISRKQWATKKIKFIRNCLLFQRHRKIQENGTGWPRSVNASCDSFIIYWDFTCHLVLFLNGMWLTGLYYLVYNFIKRIRKRSGSQGWQFYPLSLSPASRVADLFPFVRVNRVFRQSRCPGRNMHSLLLSYRERRQKNITIKPVKTMMFQLHH